MTSQPNVAEASNQIAAAAGRRLIARVLWAKDRPEQAVLAPSDVLLVGRTARANLVLRTDRKVAAVHFSLQWDGGTARLVDKSGTAGTFVHGERVHGEAEIQHGDWIRAGESNLVVYVEGHTPAPLRESDPHEQENRDALVAQALVQLPGMDEPLYAVLDAARDGRILVLLREAIDPFQNLYDGIQGEALEEVAPYLVQFRKDSGLLERLVTEGWGRRWGIFFTSGARVRDLRRHLRRFLMVKMEERREKVHFRYYDPWVLRKFLPSCSRRQLCTLFGAYREGIEQGGADAAVWKWRQGQPDLITGFWLEDDDMQLVRLTADAPGELIDPMSDEDMDEV